jgi:voltage-gated potassium channel
VASIKAIIEDTDTIGGKIFDLSIQALIVLSLISFSIETLPNISDQLKQNLRVFEIFSVGVFTLEYFSRVLVSSHRVRFIFSFFGLVDLMAILPFYIATGLDLRSLRSFRFLRLIRLMKLTRYSAAVKRFHRAFLIMKEELVLFLFATLIILYLAGVGIYYFENPAQPDIFSSVFHSLWWGVATLTTVGYGDIYPITIGGKFFTFFILFIGLGIVSIPAGLMASALSKARELDE